VEFRGVLFRSGVCAHCHEGEAKHDEKIRAPELPERGLAHGKDLDGHDDEQQPELAVGGEREQAEVHRHEQDGEQRKEHPKEEEERDREGEGRIAEEQAFAFGRRLPGCFRVLLCHCFDAPCKPEEGCTGSDKDDGSERIAGERGDERDQPEQERQEIHEAAGGGQLPQDARDTEPEGSLVLVEEELDEEGGPAEGEEGPNQQPHDRREEAGDEACEHPHDPGRDPDEDDKPRPPDLAERGLAHRDDLQRHDDKEEAVGAVRGIGECAGRDGEEQQPEEAHEDAQHEQDHGLQRKVKFLVPCGCGVVGHGNAVSLFGMPRGHHARARCRKYERDLKTILFLDCGKDFSGGGGNGGTPGSPPSPSGVTVAVAARADPGGRSG
jgi:hypothetical protein